MVLLLAPLLPAPTTPAGGPCWDEPPLPTHTGGGKQPSEVQWVWGWKTSPKPHLLTLPGHAPSPRLFILKECKLWEQSSLPVLMKEADTQTHQTPSFRLSGLGSPS